MCAKFYRNRTFNFKVMIKKPISVENNKLFKKPIVENNKISQTILEKKVGTVCPIWFKDAPPFPPMQC